MPAPGYRFLRRRTEQYHVVLAGPGIPRDDERRYAVSLLDAILGGSASSRLFQEIREIRGMAYSVYTYGSYQIKYAVYPYLDCTACKVASNSTVADMETVVTSHEIREAVTDPGDNGVDGWWENASGYEGDDKCAWHNLYRTAAGYLIQPEFSNSAAASTGKGCVVQP